MEIDFKELEKQREENILKSGKYCRVKIVIGKDDKQPIGDIDVIDVTDVETARMICCLKETAKVLEKKFPVAYGLSKIMKANTHEIED